MSGMAMLRRFCVLVIVFLFPLAQGWSDEQILPRGHPVTRYASIWENSPFLREISDSKMLVVSSSFGKHLALEGVISDNKIGVIAYVRDVETGLFLTISEEPGNSHLYFVTSASISSNPGLTWVRISNGSESAELGYNGSTNRPGAIPIQEETLSSSFGTSPTLVFDHPSSESADQNRHEIDKPKTTVSGVSRKRIRLPIPNTGTSPENAKLPEKKLKRTSSNN
jgi:hypothetical protein